MRAADPDADLEGALADWRRYRRRKRVADVHWIDVLYQAYLTGILGLVAVVFASSLVGDDPVSAAGVDDILVHGPAWLGGLAALGIALGLRSGSRGGPIALERAEVRHVLLAPVDRTTALLAPALRQLRFATFVGAVVGGIAGELASRRLPHSAAAWVACGALVGVSLVGLSFGSAFLAAGARLPRWIASLAGWGLVLLAVLDGADFTSFSPTAPLGRLALWPLDLDLVGVLPPVLALAASAGGLVLLGRVSLEAAERRSRLVTQLRFAATLQDLRTVVLLRRQLAMEVSRSRPWLRLRVRGTGRLPVFVRGLRGALRWPAARAARLVLLAVVAGGALRATWAGTTPLVVLAGLAMFVAALDGIEPLAQEVDHPSRRDASPMERGAIHLRHVPIGVLILALTAVLAAVAALVPGPGRVPAEVAFAMVVPLALGAVGGALVSVLGGGTGYSEGWSLAPPEAQGIRLAFRTAWPPAIAVIGAAPLLLARQAMEQGDPAVPAALAGAGGVLVLFVLVCGWVRVRDDIATWWKEQMEMAKTTRQEAAGADA